MSLVLSENQFYQLKFDPALLIPFSVLVTVVSFTSESYEWMWWWWKGVIKFPLIYLLACNLTHAYKNALAFAYRQLYFDVGIYIPNGDCEHTKVFSVKIHLNKMAEHGEITFHVTC